MKVISFDIGIKNMAYCILTCNNNIVIKDWNVVNLMTETPNINHKCNCIIPARTKRQTDKLCDKKAKYEKNNNYYCEKHAKSNKDYIIPTKNNSKSFIKKQKVDTLLTLCHSHFLCLDNDKVKRKKDEIVSILDNFYENKCFNVIEKQKKKNASDVDLIEIGRNMKIVFDTINEIDGITDVVIENQISPIANRMKTIQGMLAQYFIMRHEQANIHFVSSLHKIKQFDNLNLITRQQDNKKNVNSNNPNYKENKLDGVFYCKKILDINEQLNNWYPKLDTIKKDDLADSFLQGIWFFKMNNIIYYADDLKIKIV